MTDDKKSETLSVRLHKDDLKWLDDLRRVEPDLPSRGKMIRRLIYNAHINLAGKSGE